MTHSITTSLTREVAALFAATFLLSAGPAARAETPKFQLDARIAATVEGWVPNFDSPDDDPAFDFAVAVRPWGCTTETLYYQLLWDECINDFRVLHCTKTTCVLPTLLDLSNVTYSEDCDYCLLHPRCCGIVPDIGDIAGIFEVELNAATRNPALGRVGLEVSHAIGVETSGNGGAGMGMPNVGYMTNRELQFSFVRPAGTESNAAVLEIPLHLERLQLEFEEHACAEFSLIVESPQLGVLFSGIVKQCDRATGDIAPANFDISNGFLRLQDYHKIISVDVPAGTNVVDVTVAYSMSSSGDAPLEVLRRGDSNGDGTVNIADALRSLNRLFGSGPELPCDDAADVNDDGKLDVSDPINGLRYLFSGGVRLPDPGPTHCGVDPTEDDLTCATTAVDCAS